MRVVIAQVEDIPAWLRLAKQVEHLFGPLVNDHNFCSSLHENISRDSALCVRKGDGPAGETLLGGLLFSSMPPFYTIGWLAIRRCCRRRGVGKLLVEYALSLADPPANVLVTTFGPDVKAGRPARRFYEALGFAPAESAADGPEGRSRQAYRRKLH